MNRVLVLILAATISTGCYRTVYSGLTPPISEQTGRAEPAPEPNDPSYGWHHFFFWGVDPPEEVIDAAKICGGTQYVERIETEQSFLQGLIEAIAGYYVNIYSPYTARVVCTGSKKK